MPNIGRLPAREHVIAMRIDDGDTLTEIERDLVEEAPWLDEDERAGLWLFAWAYGCTARGGREEGERVGAR